jgi:hypothetical protein
MAITQRTTRYPKLPRKRKSKPGYSQKLADDVDKLYGEIVEAEAVMSLRLVGWQDASSILQSGLACMTKIATQEDNWEIAYKAAGFLITYGQQAMERSGRQIEGSQVMAQLESLYRKALPVEAEGEPLVVEEKSEER